MSCLLFYPLRGVYYPLALPRFVRGRLYEDIPHISLHVVLVSVPVFKQNLLLFPEPLAEVAIVGGGVGLDNSPEDTSRSDTLCLWTLLDRRP